MAVKLTIFPTHLLLSQTLLTGSQATQYNPCLLEMSPVLAATVWCAHLASAPLAGSCDESCPWQHKDLLQPLHSLCTHPGISAFLTSWEITGQVRQNTMQMNCSNPCRKISETGWRKLCKTLARQTQKKKKT